jgi:hypothetical protein
MSVGREERERLCRSEKERQAAAATPGATVRHGAKVAASIAAVLRRIRPPKMLEKHARPQILGNTMNNSGPAEQYRLFVTSAHFLPLTEQTIAQTK